MDFLQLASERYSVRAFKQMPVKEQHIKKIIKAGMVAPTACNNQPQKIFVVTQKEKLDALKSVCRCTFDAPLVFVMGYDIGREWKNKLKPGCTSGQTDAAIVLTHMMLQAWESGVGSCWVAYFNPDEVSKALGLTENICVTALLPAGYPAENAAPINMHFASRDEDDIVTYM